MGPSIVCRFVLLGSVIPLTACPEQQTPDPALGEHLADRALALIDEEPAVSLALAIEAVECAPGCRTRSVLQEVLGGCYLRRELGDSFRDLDDHGLVAAAMQDGTGRLYDSETGEERVRWQAHEGAAVHVIADHYQVVTAGVDGRICVFDRLPGEIRCRFDGPGGEITELRRFGMTLLVRGCEGAPTVYSIEDGEELGTMSGASERGACLRASPMGFACFEAPAPGGRLDGLRFWDSMEGPLEGPWPLVETGALVSAVDLGAFSTIWAGDDGRLYFEDSGGQPHLTYPPFDLGGIGEWVDVPEADRASELAFVVVRERESVRGVLADYERGKLSVLCPPSGEPIVDSTFGPRGERLATVRRDGVVRVWDVAEARAVASFRPAEPPEELLWAGGSRLLTRGGGGTVEVWFGGHRPDRYTVLAGGAVREVRFAPDGERALSLSDEAGVRVWATPMAKRERIRAGELLATIPPAEVGDVERAWYSADVSSVVTAHVDGRTRRWEAATGALQEERESTVGEREPVAAVDRVRSLDGRLGLREVGEGTIVVRDRITGVPVVEVRGEGSAVSCAAFSGAEGALRVIVGFEDGEVQVWPVDPLPWAKARTVRALSTAEVERERRLARPLEFR